MIGCGRRKRLRGQERAGENYLFLDENKVEYLIVDMVASCQMYASTKPCHVRLKPTSDNWQASYDIFGLALLVGYSTAVEARAQGRDVGGRKHNYLFTLAFTGDSRNVALYRQRLV